MFNISLEHYLFLGAILFTIGVLGIFLNKKNLIVILMSIELILLSVNINFIAFSSYMGELSGQIFAMLTLTVAAAEAAIGLAILVAFFRNQGSIAVEEINNLDLWEYLSTKSIVSLLCKIESSRKSKSKSWRAK